MRDDETERARRAEEVTLFRYGLIRGVVRPAEGNDEERHHARLRAKAGRTCGVLRAFPQANAAPRVACKVDRREASVAIIDEARGLRGGRGARRGR